MQVKTKTSHKMKYSANSSLQESTAKPSYSSVANKENTKIIILSYSGAKNEEQNNDESQIILVKIGQV